VKSPPIYLLLASLTVATCTVHVAAAEDLYFGVLRLQPEPDSLYVRSGELVVVKLDVSQLTQEVKACQAMLGYSSTYLVAAPGCVVAGGGAWDELIYNSWDVGAGVPGEIDTAIGVYGASIPGSGTAADGTVAVITLLAGPNQGMTEVVFQPDGDDVNSTFLSNMTAQTVWPAKIDSQTIVIDDAAPTVAITSAAQGGQELIGTGRNATQGTVEITVAAGDALSGLAGPPEVTVTPDGESPQSTLPVGEAPPGTFHYVWSVTPATRNGVSTIHATATDRSGNVAGAPPQTFNVNKNRIAGIVELQQFVGASRTVVFTATGAVTKTWVVNVTGFSSFRAPYALDEVPDGVAGISAKTAWHLRRKLILTLDEDGQARGDFTDSSKLLGGDLNASNLVNVVDYTMMKSLWYTHDPRGDINGDGFVSTIDYTIMKLNWYQQGDPL